MSLRDELLDYLVASSTLARADLRDDVSLIRSGVLDSTALFDLALWIEARVPKPLALETFDLAAEWDTPARVLAFLERHGATERR